MELDLFDGCFPPAFLEVDVLSPSMLRSYVGHDQLVFVHLSAVGLALHARDSRYSLLARLRFDYADDETCTLFVTVIYKKKMILKMNSTAFFIIEEEKFQISQFPSRSYFTYRSGTNNFIATNEMSILYRFHDKIMNQ